MFGRHVECIPWFIVFMVFDDVSESIRTVISDDDDVFQHLAKVYSFTHPIMHRGEPCPGDMFGFPNGIINGAVWYQISGCSLVSRTYHIVFLTGSVGTRRC